MKINIVGGNGAMGRVHKKIFEKYGHEVIISGRNSSPSIEEAAKESDLTIISVPINATEEVIKKIAPHCKAIADFTSLKKFPTDSMLKYSLPECEVMGIHPLYGEVESIKERTVILCKTEKTREKCTEIALCFEKEGAKLIEMDPLEHDKKVSSINQSLRVKIFTAYLSTIINEEKNFQKEFDLSPPPTKKIIELISRQLNAENDEMYHELLNRDLFFESIEDEFIKNFKNIRKDYKKYANQIREFLGEDIKKLQKDAKSSIR